MASGSFNLTRTGDTSSYVSFKCEWSSKSNGSIANSSTVTVKIIATKSSSSTSNTWGTHKTTAEVNNSSKSSSGSFTLKPGGSITLLSKSYTVPHNSDGTKTTTIEVSVGGDVMWGSGSATITLDKIPRASSVSGGSGNIGEKTTININRASSSFTHTLEYSFGSLTGTIATGVETSYSWTIPTSFYAQIPNANSGTGTITCKTYDGSTLIGSSTCSFTAKVTNSNPIIGTYAYKDSNSATTAITENNQRIIRNNSNLLFTVGSATAKNSATISKYEITFNEMTKSRTSAGDIDFGIINLSYNETATLKVTDSRGNTVTAEIEVIIDDWVLPSGLISLNRKNNFYSETYLKVDGIYSSLNDKNQMLIKYQYKKVSDNNYSSLKEISDNVEETIDLDNNYQWNIVIIISDKIGSTTYNLFLDRGMPIAFFDRKRTSASINCFPTEDKSFEVDGNVKVNGTLTVNDKEVAIAENEQSTSRINTYSCDYINNLKTIIFEGKLLGGESTTLSNVKRFLDVFVRLDFASYDGIIKYTIDTKSGDVVFGGGMMTPFDEYAMDTYYVSESKYNKNTNELTHSRIGFFGIISGGYTTRNGNSAYYIYRIDTYD